MRVNFPLIRNLGVCRSYLPYESKTSISRHNIQRLISKTANKAKFVSNKCVLVPNKNKFHRFGRLEQWRGGGLHRRAQNLYKKFVKLDHFTLTITSSCAGHLYPIFYLTPPLVLFYSSGGALQLFNILDHINASFLLLYKFRPLKMRLPPPPLGNSFNPISVSGKPQIERIQTGKWGEGGTLHLMKNSRNGCFHGRPPWKEEYKPTERSNRKSSFIRRIAT